jgi:hypothetical protein
MGADPTMVAEMKALGLDISPEALEQAVADSQVESVKSRRKQGAESKAASQETLAKVSQRNAMDRLSHGKTLCQSCGLPFPIKILNEDGMCKICVDKLAAGQTVEKVDIDAKMAEFEQVIEDTKDIAKAAKVTKAKKAKSDAKANKAPREIMRAEGTEAQAETPTVELPEGELPRGWISTQIRQLWSEGYSRRQITDALSKALDRDIKYQQVFQTVKQAELAATRPMKEGAVPCKICGTALTAEESVATGIGPICADKHQQ